MDCKSPNSIIENFYFMDKKIIIDNNAFKEYCKIRTFSTNNR